MNYLNITKYIYLIVAFLMTYNAITTWNSSTEKPWLSVIFALLGFFLFFFRRYYAKKFENYNKNKNQPQ